VSSEYPNVRPVDDPLETTWRSTPLAIGWPFPTLEHDGGTFPAHREPGYSTSRHSSNHSWAFVHFSLSGPLFGNGFGVGCEFSAANNVAPNSTFLPAAEHTHVLGAVSRSLHCHFFKQFAGSAYWYAWVPGVQSFKGTSTFQSFFGIVLLSAGTAASCALSHRYP